MFAYRDCIHDRAAALLLVAEGGGSRFIHGVLFDTGPEKFGIPLDIGCLVYVLLTDADIPGFLAAIREGADLTGVADAFALWALDRYADPCAEGDPVARHYLRFARSVARARCDRRAIELDLEASLEAMTATRPTTKPQTLPECALLAAWGVLRLKPTSAAIVAFAALRAEEIVAGDDAAARRGMANKLLTLLGDVPIEPLPVEAH